MRMCRGASVSGSGCGGGGRTMSRAPIRPVRFRSGPRCGTLKIKMTSDLLSFALAYAARGYRVHPVIQGGKNPLTSRGCLDATRDKSAIRANWGRWIEANIGIATDGLLVVDIDPAGAGWGADHEMSMTAAGGVTTKTPRGHHVWFRAPEGVDMRCSASRIAPGIDVRANGGYVVAPPSRTEHGEYVGDLPPRRELAEAPMWLVELATRAPTAGGNATRPPVRGGGSGRTTAYGAAAPT